MTLQLFNRRIKFLLDTGAAVNIIDGKTCDKLKDNITCLHKNEDTFLSRKNTTSVIREIQLFYH